VELTGEHRHVPLAARALFYECCQRRCPSLTPSGTCCCWPPRICRGGFDGCRFFDGDL
jgi:hypothetical protein